MIASQNSDDGISVIYFRFEWDLKSDMIVSQNIYKIKTWISPESDSDLNQTWKHFFTSNNIFFKCKPEQDLTYDLIKIISYRLFIPTLILKIICKSDSRQYLKKKNQTWISFQHDLLKMMREWKVYNYQNGIVRSIAMSGAFKLCNLHTFKPHLIQNHTNFFPSILGSESILMTQPWGQYEGKIILV